MPQPGTAAGDAERAPFGPVPAAAPAPRLSAGHRGGRETRSGQKSLILHVYGRFGAGERFVLMEGAARCGRGRAIRGRAPARGAVSGERGR